MESWQFLLGPRTLILCSVSFRCGPHTLRSQVWGSFSGRLGHLGLSARWGKQIFKAPAPWTGFVTNCRGCWALIRWKDLWWWLGAGAKYKNRNSRKFLKIKKMGRWVWCWQLRIIRIYLFIFYITFFQLSVLPCAQFSPRGLFQVTGIVSKKVRAMLWEGFECRHWTKICSCTRI